MKKTYYPIIFSFILVTAFFSYFLFTDPMNLLRHFYFLSPDGVIYDPSVALFKLYLPIVFLVVLFTTLSIGDTRRQVLGFVKENQLFVASISLYFLIYITTLLMSKHTLFPILFEEDGVFEYLSALFFVVAAVFFGLSLSKIGMDQNKLKMLLFLLLTIFCFFVGMEEISWGQRIFGWSTPENMKDINFQDETNLHNLIIQEGLFNMIMYCILGFGFIAFFASAHLPKKIRFNIEKEYLPGKKMYYAALLFPFLAFVDREIYEEILSVLLLIYAFQAYRYIKNSQATLTKASMA